MTFPLIVLGDTTSHNGRVISASPHSDIEGKMIARIGDMIACKKCKGVFPITTGDMSLMIDRSPAAYTGCKTSCGASLINSQFFTVAKPSGNQSGLATVLGDRFGEIGDGLAAAFEREPIGDNRYRGRFEVIESSTGKPVRNLDGQIRSTAGKLLSVVTDNDGFTAWLNHDAMKGCHSSLKT